MAPFMMTQFLIEFSFAITISVFVLYMEVGGCSNMLYRMMHSLLYCLVVWLAPMFSLRYIGINLKILSLLTLHASYEPRLLGWVFSSLISTSMCIGMCIGMCKYFLSFLCVSIWVGSYPVWFQWTCSVRV